MSPVVLVIDDDDSIRRITELALGRVGGYVVTTASGGQEGLAVAVAEPPDAILVDLMMPGMDGSATVAALQAEPSTRDIPIVLLTAKGPGAAELAGLDVHGVITKPFDAMSLADELAAILGWRRP